MFENELDIILDAIRLACMNARETQYLNNYEMAIVQLSPELQKYLNECVEKNGRPK